MLGKKLGFTENMIFEMFDAPRGTATKLKGELPNGTSSPDMDSQLDYALWFVYSKADLDASLHAILGRVRAGGKLCICFPKGSSKIKTDLSRDHGWESLLALNLKHLSLVSYDETWSAAIYRNEAATPPQPPLIEQAPYSQYFDAVARTITLPPDIAKAFTKHKKAAEAYQRLAYTNRKEYVLWILTAKREETRTNRIIKMIKMLEAGKKNPGDKGK